MKSLQGKFILILLVLFLIFAAGSIRILFMPFYLTEIDASSASVRKPLKEIVRNHQVEQTFISHFSNLGRVDIMPGTFRRKNSSVLAVLIKDEETSKIIRKVEVNSSKLPDTWFYTVTFPPIQESEHKRYKIIVRSPDASPGNAVTLWYSPRTIYDEGELKTNFQPVNGDILFRTARQVSFSEWFNNLTHKMAKGKPSIFGSPIFYTVLILIFLFGLIAFVVLIILYSF